MTRIRLRRQGRKNSPFYELVVMSQQAKRDGAFIEKIGYYEPLKNTDRKNKLTINREGYDSWIKKGAQPSATVKKLVSLL